MTADARGDAAPRQGPMPTRSLIKSYKITGSGLSAAIEKRAIPRRERPKWTERRVLAHPGARIFPPKRKPAQVPNPAIPSPAAPSTWTTVSQACPEKGWAPTGGEPAPGGERDTIGDRKPVGEDRNGGVRTPVSCRSLRQSDKPDLDQFQESLPFESTVFIISKISVLKKPRSRLGG
jgi:hypothetical protein